MSSSSNFFDLDLDNFDNAFENDIKSSIDTRWERNLKQRNNNINNNPKTPKNHHSTLLRKKSLTKTPKNHTADRFIPKSAGKHHHHHFFNSNENINPYPNNNEKKFQSHLANSLFDGDDINSRILTFKEKAPKPSETHLDNMRVLYTQNNHQKNKIKKTHRFISTTPERILDAPDLLDDYYLNLLDWNCHNILAVALSNSIFLWDASSGEIEQLLTLNNDDNEITSISWMKDGSHLAVGTSDNDVQLWNIEKKNKLDP